MYIGHQIGIVTQALWIITLSDPCNNNVGRRESAPVYTKMYISKFSDINVYRTYRFIFCYFYGLVSGIFHHLFVQNTDVHKYLFCFGFVYFITRSFLIHLFLTLGRHRHRRVLASVIASVRPSVCSSVRPKWCYRFFSLRISAISLKFGGMMYTATEQIAIQNRHAKPIFACWTKFSMIGFLTRSEGRRYRTNSQRISAICLQFGVMMHSNTKQIII